MIFAVIHVGAMLAYATIARYCRADAKSFFIAGAVSYFVAAICAVIWVLTMTDGFIFDRAAIVLGLYTGFVYQPMYIVLFGLISLGGMAFTAATNRVSSLLPILAAILLWGETPSSLRIAGTVIVLVSVPFASWDAYQRSRRRHIHKLALPLLILATLALYGSGNVASKAFVEYQTTSGPADYTVFLFIGASISTIVTTPLVRRLVIREKTAIMPSSVIYNPAGRFKPFMFGSLLGIANFTQAIALVHALTDQPATLIFPLIVGTSMLLTMLVDILVWKQWFSHWTVLGILLSAIGVIVINL